MYTAVRIFHETAIIYYNATISTLMPFRGYNRGICTRNYVSSLMYGMH